MADLNCIVVTPEETALETSAEFVALPLYDGEVGIAPGRSPMIGRLGYGEMRIRGGGKTSRYYVDGGFVQVADNVISVLTGKAVAAEKLDASEAQKHLDAAQQLPSNTPELMEIRDRSVLQARGQLRVAQRG